MLNSKKFPSKKSPAPLQIDRDGQSYTCFTRGLLLHPLSRVAGSDQGIPNNMHYVVNQLLSGFVFVHAASFITLCI